MEVRDATGPRPPGPASMQSGPGSFAAYYHRGGAGFAPGSPVMTSPHSGIHAPAAMRHASPQHIAIAVNPNSSASFPPEGSATMVPQPLSMSPTPGMGMGMSVGMGTSRAEPVKRKRGRPRKYATDANGVGSMALGLATNMGSPREKKARASGKKAQLAALGAAGQGFTPHVMKIAAGEDVAMKIVSFLQHGPWAVCILSANGAISNVTLRQPLISGGTVTYEGRYEILSLTGSFLLTESGGTRTRTGGLSVSLAGADGRVVGGGVAGLLMAATPVQVILGTFLSENRKNQVRPEVVESQHGVPSSGNATGTPSSVPMESLTRADTTGSMRDHFSGPADGDNQQQPRMSHIMRFHSMDWTGDHFGAEARDDTDTVPSSPDCS